MLDGVVGWIDCNYASVTEVGDHYIVLGGVLGMQLERDTAPLLFFQRGYGRFSPGPLIAAAERETIEAVRLAELGRDSMTALASEFSAECSIIAAVGGDVVYVALENRSPHWRLRSRLGFRVPCAPPLGPLFVGHPGAPADTQWLQRLGRADEEMTARSLAQLERVRSRGWSIALQGPQDAENLDEMVELYSNAHRTPAQERRLLAAAKERSNLHEPADLLEDVAYDVLQSVGAGARCIRTSGAGAQAQRPAARRTHDTDTAMAAALAACGHRTRTGHRCASRSTRKLNCRASQRR